MQPPRRVTSRTLLQKGDVVFEWAPKQYKTEGNPGVGPSLGFIADPVAGKNGCTVTWADDDECQYMKFPNVRLAGSNVGDSYLHGGKLYTLRKLTNKGVEVQVQKLTTRKTQKSPRMQGLP